MPVPCHNRHQCQRSRIEYRCRATFSIASASCDLLKNSRASLGIAAFLQRASSRHHPRANTAGCRSRWPCRLDTGSRKRRPGSYRLYPNVRSTAEQHRRRLRLSFHRKSIPRRYRPIDRSLPAQSVDYPLPIDAAFGQHVLHRWVIHFIHFAHAQHSGPFRLKQPPHIAFKGRSRASGSP